MINSPENERDFPKHVVRIIHQKADQDLDGRLNFDEFLQMTMNPENKSIFAHHFKQLIKICFFLFNLLFSFVFCLICFVFCFFFVSGT